ncbi:MAG: prepilin-type N-terminal cleavage/methylation domain-containing protein, partial [Eubacterium sp.]
MQFINKLKKNQKGFTLVELIVVLVILAILAAFTIPAMLGFVDDARSKASIAMAREVYVAGQSAATDQTAKAAGGVLVAGSSTDIDAQIRALVGADLNGATIASKVAGNATADGPTKGDKNKATLGIELNGTVNEV